jgi:tetratricopeptide (TPR) repeat protein
MAEGRLDRVGQVIETIWGIASRGGLFVVVSAALVVGVVEIVRACLSETVVLEPVIVKGRGGDSGPTVEMATQQIATYLNRIQSTGAREWRPPSFVDTERTLSIQIPGSSLSVDSVMRQIVEFLPHRRRIVKVSITASPNGTGHVAAVSISGGRSPKHKTCDASQDPNALEKMFECVAVEAMGVIDPLFAASYLLSVEEVQCRSFKPAAASTNPVDDMKQRLADLRQHCSFAQTRSAVGTIIYRGRKDDQPWVSYIYGKLHLARAGALAKAVDLEAQWYEYERAIRRFREFPWKEQPASVKAILMDVYLENGVAIQRSITSLNWTKDGDVMSYRLAKAAKILKEASDRLDERAEIVPRAAEAPRSIEQRRSDRYAAQETHRRGLIAYHRWMVETRRRYDGAEFGFAEGDLETEALLNAHRDFDVASKQARQSFEFYVQWGNTLRALKRFDEAVAKYRRAGDIGSTSYVPLLNIAVTLLENALREPTTDNLFDALRHTSSYLTWASDGGPFTAIPTLPDRIAGVLRASGDRTLAEEFAYCRRSLSVHEADQEVQDMSHTAALKHCVDKARDRLGKHVVEEAARGRVVSQENAPSSCTEPPAGGTPVCKPQIGERQTGALKRGSAEVATSP